VLRWQNHIGEKQTMALKDLKGVLKSLELIAWDSQRITNGYRARRRGDYLVGGIPDRWVEKVDRTLHPHVKPIGPITRLIEAITSPGDPVVDPAAGSFVAMRSAQQLGREFIGVDLAFREVAP
jgi:site-specific DNA-methyltransferase (adenine-specific)